MSDDSTTGAEGLADKLRQLRVANFAGLTDREKHALDAAIRVLWEQAAAIAQQRETIERLKADLAFYEPKCPDCGDHLGLLAECPHCRDMAALQQRAEKLTAETLRWADRVGELGKEREALRQTVERLEGERDRLLMVSRANQDLAERSAQDAVDRANERDALRPQIDALREALNHCADRLDAVLQFDKLNDEQWLNPAQRTNIAASRDYALRSAAYCSNCGARERGLCDCDPEARTALQGADKPGDGHG